MQITESVEHRETLLKTYYQINKRQNKKHLSVQTGKIQLPKQIDKKLGSTEKNGSLASRVMREGKYWFANKK